MIRGSADRSPAGQVAPTRPWWQVHQSLLLELMADGHPRYVYHLPTVVDQAQHLRRALPSVDRAYYAMKANRYPGLLSAIASNGLGIECVSIAEVRLARKILGPQVPILFTPNFCALDDYAVAIAAGCEVVIDATTPLVERRSDFAGRRIGVRIDTGRGFGHHAKVHTAGPQSKFGQPVTDLVSMADAVRDCGAIVVGLHAHVGSGILDPDVWATTGRVLAIARHHFPETEWLDLGGGFGVPTSTDEAPLDLTQVEMGIATLRESMPDVKLRVEPGRYLVSEAGVLLANVTQVRRKCGVNYVGLSTGMNSLIRPALYDAWHGIHNLTRLNEPPAGHWQVVGPVCESADVLGRDRLLPQPRSGDVMLIEHAGAYGAVMASSYNLHPQAEEIGLGLVS